MSASLTTRLRELWGVGMPQPARVVEEIARSQHESEIWVSAAQIVVITAAALAYVFTPRGFSPDAPIAAVPLGIFALILLIALRAWFAWSGQLTRPVLAASVVAEMSVLLAILWGFAPQYETTLAVALKNALFVAVFVLDRAAHAALRADLGVAVRIDRGRSAGRCLHSSPGARPGPPGRPWISSSPRPPTASTCTTR